MASMYILIACSQAPVFDMDIFSLVAFATEFSGISYYTWDGNKHIAR